MMAFCTRDKEEERNSPSQTKHDTEMCKEKRDYKFLK